MDTELIFQLCFLQLSIFNAQVVLPKDDQWNYQDSRPQRAEIPAGMRSLYFEEIEQQKNSFSVPRISNLYDQDVDLHHNNLTLLSYSENPKIPNLVFNVRPDNKEFVTTIISSQPEKELKQEERKQENSLPMQALVACYGYCLVKYFVQHM
jgi:hypothetical protein